MGGVCKGPFVSLRNPGSEAYELLVISNGEV